MTAGCRPAGVLPLLATLLTLAAVLGASPAVAAPPERDLTVLSYNIHHGVGEDGVLDLDRVAAVIRDADVDVAALQDVDRHWSARSDFADQAAELAQTLGMHYVYGANLDRDPLESGQPRRRYGNAILSRFRIRTADVIPTLASDHLPTRAAVALTAPYATVRSLDRAHADNDYQHRRPLFDALHHGFTSVEADIWLQDGELRVAHDLVDTVPGRTLESLYLDPLLAITRANRDQVYPDRTAPVQLLVDIKSDAEATYTALDKTLRTYRPMLTRYGPDGTHARAVEVVVSGNRPRDLLASQVVRWSAYDGRLPDLDGDDPASFIPLISDRWTTTFTWLGVGPMPPQEQRRLDHIVTTAHADGRRVRFWATPDQPGQARENIWRTLTDSGVDHINTDDLAGLRAFLLAADS